MDARENQKALIALAQCSTQQTSSAAGCGDTTALTPPTFVNSTAGGSESDDSVGAASGSGASNCDIAQQDKEIRDLTKDFSTCAATFGHPPLKTKIFADIVYGNSPPEILVEDESAKDCL